MSCNQKTSNILKAATVFLSGQGKKALGSRASTIFAGEVTEDDSFLTDRTFRAAGLFPSELAELTDRKAAGFGKKSDLPVEQQHGRKNKPEIKDDAPVEILGVPEAEGVRPDRDEQASECSSSFGFSDATSGDEATTNNDTEGESAARDGNGALETDSRRRPLNMDWKNNRRGIEWRCRWLDIRLMELQRRAQKYDDVLAEIQKAKPWDGRKEPDGAARTAPVLEERPAQPLLHRQRRRKLEETVDVADYMSKHPLFQRYEKKKRESDGNQLKEPNDLAEGMMARLELQDVDGVDEDSVENLMLKVEMLQARVVKLRNQLRGSMSHKLPGRLVRAGAVAARPAAKSASARPSRAAPSAKPYSPAAMKGAQAARRRASDFDINNVVMPVSVGAKYVKHVRHANIETPQWRLSKSVEAFEEGKEDSSDEDTDDESYRNRHAPLEALERHNRYGPRTNKKTPEGGDKSGAREGRASGSHQVPQCSLSAQFSEG